MFHPTPLGFPLAKVAKISCTQTFHVPQYPIWHLTTKLAAKFNHAWNFVDLQYSQPWVIWEPCYQDRIFRNGTLTMGNERNVWFCSLSSNIRKFIIWKGFPRSRKFRINMGWLYQFRPGPFDLLACTRQAFFGIVRWMAIQKMLLLFLWWNGGSF